MEIFVWLQTHESVAAGIEANLTAADVIISNVQCVLFVCTASKYCRYSVYSECCLSSFFRLLRDVSLKIKAPDVVSVYNREILRHGTVCDAQPLMPLAAAGVI